MEHIGWFTAAGFLIDLLIRVGLSVRVIMRRLPVGTSLAWLAVILIFPVVGAVFYLLVGEYRLGRSGTLRRAALRALRASQPAPLHPVHHAGKDFHDPQSLSVARLAESLLGAEVLHGNHVELLGNADFAFPALIDAIDRAQRFCHVEFYIWTAGGRANDVAAALARAADRGVTCRVLLDAVGSGEFLRSQSTEDLRKHGVQIQAALPVGLLRLLTVRPDLRLHRKIVVIDGEVGFTGSLNLADPLLFKQSAGVGQWVDAFARLRGPVVAALDATFREDWAVETGTGLEPFHPTPDAPPLPGAGEAVLQVLPSGPDERVEAIAQVVLMAVYAATREVILTTPYFVPSESLLTALIAAAARGVEVTLLVPARVDSRLAHYASRAHQTDLLAAGARVALFQGGLLHTKSITVDGRFSLFGSLNLDPRSLRLDFEITLVVYDVEFTVQLRRLQQQYLERSEMLDLAACRARSRRERFAEDAARLVGPLL